MNKRMKYFVEGMIAAFVLAPRVPVKAVEPVVIKEHIPVGNASKHWEVVGKRMTSGTKQISAELSTTHPELNSI
ncbi:hypothetical protein [Acinetobacter radioresistens]|uniref:hypothetical protein n=1 Tax=Acinetobacter radioresistens TaxID=40216 RepID=UPI000C348B69|nr:hypothetical protein [Acinetobacter radioresistens]PKD80250.1 hypothetical protein CW313_13755 [Acinetobacter radioresistens]